VRGVKLRHPFWDWLICKDCGKSHSGTFAYSSSVHLASYTTICPRCKGVNNLSNHLYRNNGDIPMVEEEYV
jgi:phage FluMu protein Com